MKFVSVHETTQNYFLIYGVIQQKLINSSHFIVTQENGKMSTGEYISIILIPFLNLYTFIFNFRMRATNY